MLGVMAAAMMPDTASWITDDPRTKPGNWQRSKSKAAKRKLKLAKKARKRNR